MNLLSLVTPGCGTIPLMNVLVIPLVVFVATTCTVTPPTFVLDAGPSQSVWIDAKSGSTTTMQLQGRVLTVATETELLTSPPSVEWSLVKGPMAVEWSDPMQLRGNVTFNQAGLYVLQLLGKNSSVRGSVCAVTVYPSNHTFGYSPTARQEIFGTNPNLNFQFDGIDWSNLLPPPSAGVHPRILFGPQVRIWYATSERRAKSITFCPGCTFA